MAMDAAANRLSAISAATEKWNSRALNFFLRNVRAIDPAEAERRIGTARENIRDLERRLQVLQEEQQALIVQAVTFRDRENN